MDKELKILIGKGLYYFYVALLFGFFLSIFLLIGNIGMKKDIDWNGVLLFYGIIIPSLILLKFSSKKFKQELGRTNNSKEV